METLTTHPHSIQKRSNHSLNLSRAQFQVIYNKTVCLVLLSLNLAVTDNVAKGLFYFTLPMLNSLSTKSLSEHRRPPTRQNYIDLKVSIPLFTQRNPGWICGYLCPPNNTWPSASLSSSNSPAPWSACIDFPSWKTLPGTRLLCETRPMSSNTWTEWHI